MDLIEEEENEIFGNEETLDLPNEGIETIQVDEDENDEKEEDKDENDKKPVKPKRVIKNPRVVLNAELLKGPKGLGNLDKCFERVQFKGKGYEEQDLNVLLKTYEYWCHRMFPKFPFKDAIAKIETLGSKGPIQTHLKKVRSGMIEDETVGVLPEFNSEDEDNETPPSNSVQSTSQTFTTDIPIQLTEEQLETIRINREKAEKLRQERLRRIKEKASLNLPEKTVPLIAEANGYQNDCIPSKSTDVTSDNGCALEQDLSTNLNTLQEGLENRELINTESESDDELKSVKKSTKNVFHNDDEEEEEPMSRVEEETIAEVEEEKYEETRIIDDIGVDEMQKEESTGTSFSKNDSEDTGEQMEVDE